MNAIEDHKSLCMSRIRHLLLVLKEAKEPFDIEAHIFTIKTTAEAAHEAIHKINEKERL